MRISSQSRSSASIAESLCVDAIRRITVTRQPDRRKINYGLVWFLTVDGVVVAVSQHREIINEYLDLLMPKIELSLVDDSEPESYDPYNTARLKVLVA